MEGVRLGVMPGPGRPEPAKLGRPDMDGLLDALDVEGVVGAEGCPSPSPSDEGVFERAAGVRGAANPLPSPACRYDEGGCPCFSVVGVSGSSDAAVYEDFMDDGGRLRRTSRRALSISASGVENAPG